MLNLLKYISIHWDIINENDKHKFTFQTWHDMLHFFKDKSDSISALENDEVQFVSPLEDGTSIGFKRAVEILIEVALEKE